MDDHGTRMKSKEGDWRARWAWGVQPANHQTATISPTASACSVCFLLLLSARFFEGVLRDFRDGFLGIIKTEQLQ
jgi:hypothetical protein